ncbi:hypothetical protein RYX36_036407 [Vicia faba]
MNAYKESQRKLQSLQQDKEKYGKILESAQDKAKKISSKKLDVVLLRQKDLEKELSELTNTVIVNGRAMVYEKAITSLDPEHPSACEKSEAQESGKPEGPQQEHVVLGEESQGE